MLSLLRLDPATYRPSALHNPDRTFCETNCYVDLWIELLHAHGINPVSTLSFTCMVDFEGDQWTFFKPPLDEVLHLCGIECHEMQLYRPTVDHAIEQLQRSRTIIIEVDSFYLPDTLGTSYRSAHGKSSIAIEALDPEGERLHYFHGAGYHALSGEDFRGVFRLGRPFSEDVLPPYTEVVRFDAGPRLDGDDLRRAALDMLRQHLAHRPRRNPWLEFGQRVVNDLPDINSSAASAHAYAFATVRQCGAAFELARSFVEWLVGTSSTAGAVAGECLGRQVNGAKALLFRLARRRMFDPRPEIEQLAADWETAMAALESLALAIGHAEP